MPRDENRVDRLRRGLTPFTDEHRHRLATIMQVEIQ